MWYAVNGEIFDYVQAFERLEYSVENSMIKNPSAKDVYLNFYGKDIKVPAGEEILIK